MLLRTFFKSVVLVAVFAEGSASAASIEASARLGYGSAGDSSPTVYEPSGRATLQGGPDKIYSGDSSPYGGGINFAGGLGVRLGIVSFGIDGGARSSSATSPDSTITDLSRSAFFVGPYVHAYIPNVPFVEPWIGVGAQYVFDTQKYKAPTQGINADWTLEHHGVAIPLTVGVDYTVADKILAFGPFFTFAPTLNAGGCAKVSSPGYAGNNFCTNESNDALKITKSKGYTSWIIGLNVRFSFPPPK